MASLCFRGELAVRDKLLGRRRVVTVALGFGRCGLGGLGGCQLRFQLGVFGLQRGLLLGGHMVLLVGGLVCKSGGFGCLGLGGKVGQRLDVPGRQHLVGFFQAELGDPASHAPRHSPAGAVFPVAEARTGSFVAIGEIDGLEALHRRRLGTEEPDVAQVVGSWLQVARRVEAKKLAETFLKRLAFTSSANSASTSCGSALTMPSAKRAT